ncbi:oocyte zinc finger protein XlCOF19-like [Branchiostoma floridae]|uniref:Oocyte zinc finger protein XlCOF19-like n=1 Tax=Branchiostoma floridae TaxID=7739 RepID=A0A9J7HPL2_BRAFL|nr:oocyte zinc finger protein XlCOF19-like [Branchiostoma floridae]
MQENALTAFAETTLSETSSPDPSQQSSGLDLVIKKEKDIKLRTILDDRETDFINSRHEQRRKAGGEETPLAPCEPNPGRDSESEPTPGRDYENMSSLIPVNSSGIDSKRSVCELETSFVNSSSKHRKRHKGEKPFMCGECGYRARKKCRLVDHMRTHTGEKPFKCNQCNFKTPYERNLVDHMKKHTSVEPYSCEICEYQTYRKPDLERHMMSHTGVKPYKCKDCDYRTTHKSHLTRHMRRHTGERYSCQECDYKTIDKSNLTRHMRKKHA